MKAFFSLLFVASAYLVSAQNLLLIEGVYCMPDSTPFSGEYSTFYPSGNKAAVYNMREGKLHNTTTIYKENGAIEHTGTYYYGVKDGLWQSVDDRGRVLSQIRYKKGKKTGEWFIQSEFDDAAYLLYFANDHLLSSRTVEKSEQKIFSRR